MCSTHSYRISLPATATACVRTDRHKFILCSGKRKRDDGYETDKPTPGRYIRLYDLKQDPGEFTDIAKKEPELVSRFEQMMLDRFMKTHPEAEKVPSGAAVEEKIEWFLRPRDAFRLHPQLEAAGEDRHQFTYTNDCGKKGFSPMGGDKSSRSSRTLFLLLVVQIAEKSCVQDHRRERLPRPASTIFRNSGSALGTGRRRKLSNNSAPVSHGSGSSLTITSEKLSPGSFSLFRRL